MKKTRGQKSRVRVPLIKDGTFFPLFCLTNPAQNKLLVADGGEKGAPEDPRHEGVQGAQGTLTTEHGG
jgi:hypothetical protein